MIKPLEWIKGKIISMSISMQLLLFHWKYCVHLYKSINPYLFSSILVALFKHPIRAIFLPSLKI